MKTLTAIVICAMLTSLGGCDGDEGAIGPQGPGGPRLQGNILGSVRVFGRDGTLKPTFAGVRVYIEGSTDTASTDSLGRWKLANVSSGIYSIVLTMSGYGFTKFPQVQFIGGGDLYVLQTDLVEVPNYTVTGVQVILDAQGVTVHGTLSASIPDIRWQEVRFGKADPDIADPSTYLQSDGGVTYASQSVYTTPPRDDSYFLDVGFHRGDTIHVAVFPVSKYHSYYQDPATGRIVTGSGVGVEAARTTFVLP